MKKNYLFMAALVSIGMLASCSSSENQTTDNPTAESSIIRLKISAGTASTSRAGGASGTTDLPTGDGTITNSGSNEAKINRLTVALFTVDGADTTFVKSYEYTNSADINYAETSGLSISTAGTENCIVVAANLKSGLLTSSLSKIADYEALVMPLTYTTSDTPTPTTANSQSASNLPMVSAPVSFTYANKVASPTVALTRMVARVSLSSLTLNTGSKFVPQEVFMYNANDNISGLTSTYLVPTALGAVQTGESTTPTGGTTTATTLTATSTDYSYLSSGVVSDLSSITKPYFFYIYPHQYLLSDKYPVAMVIKGIWTEGGNSTVVYYPIRINKYIAGSTTFTDETALHDGRIMPNTRYDIAATITAKGSTNPANDAINAITLTVTVNAWASTSTETVSF